jgi:hypothetical protein
MSNPKATAEAWAAMPWYGHVSMLLFLLGGAISLALGKGGPGGIPAVAVMVPVGVAVLIVGGILLRGLMVFKHGLLDARNKVRVDVLGDVASRQKDPTLFELCISLMSVKQVGERFYAYVLKQLGVDNEVEFGKEMLFRLGEAFKNDPNPLTRGDLKAAAQQRWKMWKDELGELQGQFELHESLPSHMEPSVFMHDKLISGDPLSF